MAVLESQRRKPARNTVSRKRRLDFKRSSMNSNTKPSFGRRIFTVVRYTFYTLCVCTFVAIVVTGGVRAYAFVTDSPYFAIKDITISGTNMLSDEAVLELTGIELGTNTFSVDLNEVEDRVAMSPWCAFVSVKRLLPDRFEIAVQEHEPAFWMVQGDELYYTDIQGNILAPVVLETFRALPQLTIGRGGEVLLPRLEEFFQTCKEAQLLVSKSLFSWIRVSAGKGIEWYTDEPSLLVSVDTENLRTNLDRTRLVLKDLGRRGDFHRIKEIVAVGGSVWVIANDASSKVLKGS